MHSTSKKDHREESRSRDNSMSSQAVNVTLKDLTEDIKEGILKKDSLKILLLLPKVENSKIDIISILFVKQAKKKI